MKKFTLKQPNLTELSKEMFLETDEIHQWNDFYGHATVLKKHILFKIKSLYFTLEHGVSIDEIIWHIDKNSTLRFSVTYSNIRKKIYENQLKKYVFNIGSIMNYVDLKEKYTKNGSIYFLTHSTHEVDVNLNSQLIINELKNLPNNLIPKYVCLYWKDIQRNKHEIFLKNGFKVVTAGHMYDNLFLYRLKEILLNFEILLTSELGSHVFHAYACGLKIIVPNNLTNFFLDEKYKLSEFYSNYDEKNEIDLSIDSFNQMNEVFISIFSNNNLVYEDLQTIFLNYFCTTKKKSRLSLTIIHVLGLLTYKFHRRRFFNHFFDFFFIRINKFF
jgi:hypothetical protein